LAAAEVVTANRRSHIYLRNECTDSESNCLQARQESDETLLWVVVFIIAVQLFGIFCTD
jgi:hypothetical protein